MINEVIYFDSIRIKPPFNKFYTRLGYRKNMTRLLSGQKKDIERSIKEALLLVDLKGAALRLKIENTFEGKIQFNRNIVLTGRSITLFLKNSEEALLMGATCGNEIINSIHNKSKNNDLATGVVLDAVASEMADSALDWIMNYFNQIIKRENKSVTKRRFSAGYGDFDICNQKKIHSLLKLNKIGIKINKNYMLIPEKSVTAIAGINRLYA